MRRAELQTKFGSRPNPYFGGMVNQMYPPEPPLNKANASETLAVSIFNNVFAVRLFEIF